MRHSLVLTKKQQAAVFCRVFGLVNSALALLLSPQTSHTVRSTRSRIVVG